VQAHQAIAACPVNLQVNRITDPQAMSGWQRVDDGLVALLGLQHGMAAQRAGIALLATGEGEEDGLRDLYLITIDCRNGRVEFSLIGGGPEKFVRHDVQIKEKTGQKTGQKTGRDEAKQFVEIRRW